MLGRSNRKAEKHLRFIRNLPCLVCGAYGSEACHIRYGTGGGMGLKPHDKFTVPLCHDHHMLQHSVGEVSFWDWAGDGVEHAVEVSNWLWDMSGKRDKVQGTLLELVERWKEERKTKSPIK